MPRQCNHSHSDQRAHNPSTEHVGRVVVAQIDSAVADHQGDQVPQPASPSPPRKPPADRPERHHIRGMVRGERPRTGAVGARNHPDVGKYCCPAGYLARAVAIEDPLCNPCRRQVADPNSDDGAQQPDLCPPAAGKQDRNGKQQNSDPERPGLVKVGNPRHHPIERWVGRAAIKGTEEGAV